LKPKNTDPQPRYLARSHHTRPKVEAEQSKRRPTLAHCHTKPKEIHREIRAKKLPQLETNRMQA
jgi:hypothetical protein